MRASVRIGSIEIALTTASPRLERLLGERYAAFLGAVDDPALAIELIEGPSRRRSEPGVRIDGNQWHLALGSAAGSVARRRGTFRVRADASSVDQLLHVLAGLCGPGRGTLLMMGAGVVASGFAHLFLGATPAVLATFGRAGLPILSKRSVAVHRDAAGAWSASWTPFAQKKPPSGGRAPLAVVWHVTPREGHLVPLTGADCARLLLEHALVPSRDRDLMSEVFDLAAAAGGAVTAARVSPSNRTVLEHLDAHRQALALRSRVLPWVTPALERGVLRPALGGMRGGG